MGVDIVLGISIGPKCSCIYPLIWDELPVPFFRAKHPPPPPKNLLFQNFFSPFFKISFSKKSEKFDLISIEFVADDATNGKVENLVFRCFHLLISI